MHRQPLNCQSLFLNCVVCSCLHYFMLHFPISPSSPFCVIWPAEIGYKCFIHLCRDGFFLAIASTRASTTCSSLDIAHMCRMLERCSWISVHRTCDGRFYFGVLVFLCFCCTCADTVLLLFVSVCSWHSAQAVMHPAKFAFLSHPCQSKVCGFVLGCYKGDKH